MIRQEGQNVVIAVETSRSRKWRGFWKRCTGQVYFGMLRWFIESSANDRDIARHDALELCRFRSVFIPCGLAHVHRSSAKPKLNHVVVTGLGTCPSVSMSTVRRHG